MAKITLKLQDLQNGVASFREFEDEPEAMAFLQERPRFTDVLGVVFEGLTKEQNARLRAAMRPLDEEERKAEEALAEIARKAAEVAAEARRVEEEAAMAAHRASMKNADPNRVMEVRYRFDTGITLLDPTDPREVTEEARAAILEWVTERNTWVEDRGQVVGDAKLSVWPGTLPKAGMARVQGGSFIPVSAPAKPESKPG